MKSQSPLQIKPYDLNKKWRSVFFIVEWTFPPLYVHDDIAIGFFDTTSSGVFHFTSRQTLKVNLPIHD